MSIKIKSPSYSDNHPIVEGNDPFARALNKRIDELWIQSGWGSHQPTVDQIALDLLVEDYNKRHAPRLVIKGRE